MPPPLGPKGRYWRSEFPVLLAVAVSIVFWSSNFPTIRFILQAYDPLTKSVLRVWVGAALLGGVALFLRLPLPAWRDWWIFAAFGLTGIALATVFLNTGLKYVSAGSGSFLIGTVPVFSALLALIFLRERLGGRGWLGIGVSLGGVGLIALGEGGGLQFRLEALFVVASAFNQALFYVFQKFCHRRYTPFQITCFSIWCGAVIMLVFAGELPAVVARAPWSHTLAVVYLGIFPTALAFSTWNFALSRARAAKVTSSLYALPALAIALAYFWLGELPPALSVAGGMVALLGVAMVHLWDR